MKFTQIAHEKRFKFVLMGQFTLITACVVLLFVWTQIVEPGALFGRLHFLKGEVEPEVNLENQLVEQLLEPEGGNAYLVFILFGNGATALAMLTAEICACAMRPASLTIIHPGCSVGLVVNVIPFFTINLSIVMIIVVQTVAMVFFGFLAPFWLIISAVITTILVTSWHHCTNDNEEIEILLTMNPTEHTGWIIVDAGFMTQAQISAITMARAVVPFVKRGNSKYALPLSTNMSPVKKCSLLKRAPGSMICAHTNNNTTQTVIRMRRPFKTNLNPFSCSIWLNSIG